MKQVSGRTWIDPKPKPEVSGRHTREDAFVARAEALRLRQEWVHDLDMRRFVSQPCRRCRYRNRFLWLDEASRKLFRAGLARDGGVFTVATCEKMLAAAELETDRRLPRAPAGGNAVLARLTDKRTTDDVVVQQLHAVLKLGYFEKRRKDRIKYTARVYLIGDERILPARTRDISETGLRIHADFLGDYRVGDVVQVKFPNILEIKDIQVCPRDVQLQMT